MSPSCTEPPPRPRGRARGATLIEALIYAATFLMVLGAIYASLLMGLDAYRQTERFADLQQQAMAALRSLTEDLSGCPRGSARAEPGALVLLSARDPGGRLHYDSSGRLLWQAWILYHLEQEGERGLMSRYEWNIAPVADPPDTIPTVDQVRGAPGVSRRAVAWDVTGLDVQGGASPEIRLTASTPERGGSALDLLDRVHFRP